MRVAEFAARVGVHPNTVRQWDRDGRLPVRRTPGGHRYFEESDVYTALSKEQPEAPQQTVLYSRVSSRAQKSDLLHQQQSLEAFAVARGFVIDQSFSDVASGLNFERPGFLKLMDAVEDGRIKTILVAHRDRLVRFGFEYFETRVGKHGGEIIVLNAETMSPQQELVEDLLSIIHVFSSRMYGLRRYSKMIQSDHDDDKLEVPPA